MWVCKGFWYTNAIFILRHLCEKAIEVRKDLYACFIDYTKAFDRVRHTSLIDILQDLDMDGKDLRIMQNLYWNQEAAVRYENEYSQFCSIKRRVRQRCVFSSDLFNLYSESIIRTIQDIKGVIAGGFKTRSPEFAIFRMNDKMCCTKNY